MTLAVTSAEALRKQRRKCSQDGESPSLHDQADRKWGRQSQSCATSRRANTSDSTEFDIDDSDSAERDQWYLPDIPDQALDFMIQVQDYYDIS